MFFVTKSEKYLTYAAAFRPILPINSATSEDLIPAIAASKAAKEKLPPFGAAVIAPLNALAAPIPLYTASPAMIV